MHCPFMILITLRIPRPMESHCNRIKVSRHQFNAIASHFTFILQNPWNKSVIQDVVKRQKKNTNYFHFNALGYRTVLHFCRNFVSKRREKCENNKKKLKCDFWESRIAVKIERSLILRSSKEPLELSTELYYLLEWNETDEINVSVEPFYFFSLSPIHLIYFVFFIVSFSEVFNSIMTINSFEHKGFVCV